MRYGNATMFVGAAIRGNPMDNASLAAATLALAMVVPAAGVRAAELTVLAGGSMTASLKELGARFEAATAHKLVIRFAGTPELIKQATSGAPFELASKR